MKVNIQDFITAFEEKIEDLVSVFKYNDKDFFFTEKEIHSYFYHLCLNSNKFITGNGINLIHTEYPTPFKCKKGSNWNLDYAKIDEDKMRSHIDLVLINPNFVNWIYDEKKETKYLTGITNDIFSHYILDFAKVYKDFQAEFNEPILLYALEFKYFRHSYSGAKYPKGEIHYDLAKLDLLKNKNFAINNITIHFCLKSLSIVFIGHKINEKIFSSLAEFNRADCRLIHTPK